jgi:anti-sigma-K factor RskA
MTDPRKHQEWAELAAGHALHALVPAEEQRFLQHAAECPDCTAALDDYNLVAAQLGALADAEPDQVPSWSRIRTGIVDDESPNVVRLDSRRRRAPRLLSAAAAAVVVAALGIVGWQAVHSGTSSPATGAAALTACQHEVSCRVVRLHTSNGANPAAVLVSGDQATVVPLRLAAAPTGRTYVLWQMPSDGGPVPLSEFRKTSQQTAAVRLPTSYADTAAFAISVEPAGVAPKRPTHVLAVGSAS